MKWSSIWLVCAAFLLTVTRLEASPRVALMDFSTDDNSYLTEQAAANFTGLLQAQLADGPGVEWVERTQLTEIVSRQPDSPWSRFAQNMLPK